MVSEELKMTVATKLQWLQTKEYYYINVYGNPL